MEEAHNAGFVGGSRSSDPSGLIGRCCGGYRITKLLGEGGMGQVYLGVNEHLGKRAAIKVLLPVHSLRLRAESRFLQEARAAAQIDDPNIVDILDACEFSDGRFYILMPFIEGGSLEELCERMGPLPLEVAAEILLQICGGLDAAHRHGIIHRDIKPQNILVGPRQQRQHFATIVDFGIAKLLDGSRAGVHTESKALIGTPGYMAPEQARGSRDIDARVDVYAVGTLAYRILTGRTPYLDETLYGLIEKQITNAPFPTPRELRPNVPPLWDQAILQALAIDRNRRLSSVREFAELLARGIPRGEQLARALVPQLVSSPVLPPDAAPISGLIGDQTVPMQMPMQTPMPANAPTVSVQTMSPHPRPARRVMSFALSLATASVLGSAATYAAMGSEASPVAASSTVNEGATSGAANGVTSGATKAVAKATVATSAESTPSATVAAAPPIENGKPATAPDPAAPSQVVAATPASAKPVPAAPAAKTSTNAPAKASVPSAPAKDPVPSAPVPVPVAAPIRPAAAEAPRKRVETARTGVIVVSVKGWAEVFIDGERIGYAPLRRELPPGQYQVVLQKDGQKEQVKVTVYAGKTATITRDL